MEGDAIDLVPSDAQADAIRKIVAWYRAADKSPQIFYLAGLAGTGKSTIYKLAMQELRAAGLVKSTVTCAPTGKAANVLRKKGTPEAMTCHAALYSPVEDEETGEVTFVLNELSPAMLADIIGIDESSMVGNDMAQDFISTGKKILAMGDPGQLQPVGDEGFFTKREADVFLTEIHRQALDSPIIRLAHMAREGKKLPLFASPTVNVLRLTKETAVLVYRPETQPIVGTHKCRWTITRQIRERRGHGGEFPREGERVMCMRNNRELGIFNGGQGFMRQDARSRASDFVLDVQMDDLAAPIKKLTVHPWHFSQHFKVSERPFREMRGKDEFDWGYVLTCHKAQGSEWDDVTIVDDSSVFRDERWKWLYTAITRSSNRMTLLLRQA